jgi:MFS superfamily sulfate permease-like transporter
MYTIAFCIIMLSILFPIAFLDAIDKLAVYQKNRIRKLQIQSLDSAIDNIKLFKVKLTLTQQTALELKEDIKDKNKTNKNIKTLMKDKIEIERIISTLEKDLKIIEKIEDTNEKKHKFILTSIEEQITIGKEQIKAIEKFLKFYKENQENV